MFQHYSDCHTSPKLAHFYCYAYLIAGVLISLIQSDSIYYFQIAGNLEPQTCLYTQLTNNKKVNQ